MTQQIKLHNKQLISSTSLVTTIQLFEDELNILLTQGWSTCGPMILVDKPAHQTALLIQPMIRESQHD
jgi:hypothetical protein